MSYDQFVEPDPVEQFYSFVPDNCEDEERQYLGNLQENAVFKELGSYSTSTLHDYVESCSRPAAMRKRINALPKTSTPFENSSKLPTKRIFTSNRRNSTGLTCESFSEEGSSDDEVTKPMYRNHQLLGDSQFVRFSKQILGMRYVNRSVAYCVSGQRIQGLHNMLVNKEYKLHSNVILMIGTNDLRHNSALTRMKESYLKLLELLKELTEKIVLVTIPPIQSMADSIQHWRTFEGFNNFILQQHNGKQIFVLDFGQHLVGYTGFRGCKEYFEEIYSSVPDKKDLMHLNKKGFQLLKFLLDLHYFSSIH